MTGRALWMHPAALADLDAAGEWYDEQVLGLSLELLDAVQEAIGLIEARPLAWQRDDWASDRNLRRFVMRRFPFSIVYEVTELEVRIVAVAHFRRNPRYWRDRL